MSDTTENPADDSGKNSDGYEMVSHLDGIAIQLHEMYQSLQRAGFDDKSALRLIGFAVSAGIMEPYFEESAHANITDDGYDEDDDGDYV